MVGSPLERALADLSDDFALAGWQRDDQLSQTVRQVVFRQVALCCVVSSDAACWPADVGPLARAPRKASSFTRPNKPTDQMAIILPPGELGLPATLDHRLIESGALCQRSANDCRRLAPNCLAQLARADPSRGPAGANELLPASSFSTGLRAAAPSVLAVSQLVAPELGLLAAEREKSARQPIRISHSAQAGATTVNKHVRQTDG